MLALEEGDLQFKYWRPFVLFLCAIDGDANYVRQRGMLDALAQLVRRGKGLALVNGVVVDEVAEPSLRKARKARRRLRAQKVEEVVGRRVDVGIRVDDRIDLGPDLGKVWRHLMGRRRWRWRRVDNGGRRRRGQRWRRRRRRRRWRQRRR